MKKFLLAGVAALALAMTPISAFAITPVFDAEAIAGILKSVGLEGQQLDQLTQQLQQLAQTYQKTAQIYDQATHIANDVSGITGADQWAPGLNATRSWLPFSANVAPGWIAGSNDPGTLPFGTQYLNQNVVGGDPSIYTRGDIQGQQILQQIRSISALQAIGTNGLQTIESRLAGLSDLFTRLSSLGTLQDVSSLTARLSSEQNFATAQQAQATQLMASAQLQHDAFESAQRQIDYQYSTREIAAACAAITSGVKVPACAGVTTSMAGQ